MARTYEPIASVTLGSDNATGATFTSVPASFTDLVLVFAGAIDTNHASILCQVNDDTGSNYSGTYLAGSFSTTTSSTRESNRTSARLAHAVSYGALANEQHMVRSIFQSYSNTNVNKTILSESNGSYEVSRIVDLWRSTTAINKIVVFVPGTAKFKSGSTFSLFGIKASA